ncbi:hypothetical protein DMH03_13085 [Amycolatopsis sp. WAC 01376]|uniref:hypothetical protein n=1 Tax=Amycolatopsis sp. WAC 01376 TaxID=2203195 RepID=UPI000F771E65|nr:hypothetical protein [Amycolatopsis sp. WAC 01376]RSM62974.1 hypothetical protein DMH03_13085 [Amycolatopsis sp. WAC 01376]
MKQGSGSLLGRIIGIVAGLLVLGLFLRLIAGILSPILPAPLWQAISSGWDMLYGTIGPALPAIGAAVILGGIVWVIIGRRK